MAAAMRLSGWSSQPAAPSEEFRSAFDILDADHDGKISHLDLQSFYASNNNISEEISSESGAKLCLDQVDPDIIGSMISLADSNNDGYVEYHDFKHMLTHINNNNKLRRGGIKGDTDVMEGVFKAMDIDGDGKLGHGDLKSYMSFAGLSATDDDIKSMIMLAAGDDNDINAGVTFEGLLRILAID